MDHQDAKLWNLLGQANRHAAPPFFAASVLRRIEATEASVASPWFTPLLRWFAPAAIAALVLFAVFPRTDTEAPLPELTTMDLLEILNPEDHDILTTAGWPYTESLITAAR